MFLLLFMVIFFFHTNPLISFKLVILIFVLTFRLLFVFFRLTHFNVLSLFRFLLSGETLGVHYLLLTTLMVRVTK